MMTLDEWASFSDREKSKVFISDENEYLALAQEAARRFLSEGHMSASYVYLADRFGELLLSVYVPDEVFYGFGGGWDGVVQEYNGFRLIVQPERQMLPGLDSYAGQYFFSRRA